MAVDGHLLVRQGNKMETGATLVLRRWLVGSSFMLR